MSVPSTSAQLRPGAKPHPAALPSRDAYYRLRRVLAASALLVALLCVWISPFSLGIWLDVAILTGLAVAASLLPVRLPGSHMFTIPLIPILFSIVGLHGVSAALFAATSCMIASGFVGLTGKRRFQVKNYLPNVSAHIISVGGGGLLYFYSVGV